MDTDDTSPDVAASPTAAGIFDYLFEHEQARLDHLMARLKATKALLETTEPTISGFQVLEAAGAFAHAPGTFERYCEHHRLESWLGVGYFPRGSAWLKRVPGGLDRVIKLDTRTLPRAAPFFKTGEAGLCIPVARAVATKDGLKWFRVHINEFEPTRWCGGRADCVTMAEYLDGVKFPGPAGLSWWDPA